MFIRKTKIVCSIGPASNTDEIVRALIIAGMNVARFNFSHGDHASHKIAMDRVKRVSKELDMPVALLLDTKGPEIRTGMVENGGTVSFKVGDMVRVGTDGGLTTGIGSDGTPGYISVTWKDIAARVSPGNQILIADGLLELDVLKTDGTYITCQAKNNAALGSRKNVNLIGLHPGLPIINEQDKADIAFGAEQEVDFIAASFLSFPHEIITIQEYLKSLNFRAKIIAKIESEEGVDNIEEITRLADGVMVARGDLGVQIPTERIPLIQKRIIEVCRREYRPVITATQMLESMIVNPRPTRAELTDVANAIFDGTDAVMLSGETANGAYPVEAVTMMSKIAGTVEESDEYRRRMAMQALYQFDTIQENIGNIVSHAAYQIAKSVHAKAIVTPTLTGTTARLISTFRPEQPVLAVTPDIRTIRFMSLLWGVVPKQTTIVDVSDEMIQNAVKIAVDTGLAQISDKIVMVAGLPLHSPLMINSVRVLIVGNLLSRGASGGCANPNSPRTGGRILLAASPDEGHLNLDQSGGEILVCPILTKAYIPIIRLVKGVICESVSHLDSETLKQINPTLVWITGVHDALRNFEPGLAVTIDGKAALVYEGII
jgi:pyruvate kinase